MSWILLKIGDALAPLLNRPFDAYVSLYYKQVKYTKGV